MPRPKLIIVTGRPGAGKSTLSARLSSEWHLPLLSRDSVKEGLLSALGKSHAEAPEANKQANEAFFSTAEALLKGGVSLIIEAAFQHRLWEVYLEPLRDMADAVFILCDVTKETARERIERRALSDEAHVYFHGKAEAGEYIAPDMGIRLIRVSTEGEVDTNALKKEVFK